MVHTVAVGMVMVVLVHSSSQGSGGGGLVVVVVLVHSSGQGSGVGGLVVVVVVGAVISKKQKEKKKCRIGNNWRHKMSTDVSAEYVHHAGMING